MSENEQKSLNKNWKVDAAAKNLGKLLYDDEFGYYYFVGGRIRAVFDGDEIYAKVGDRYVPFQNNISIRMDFDSLISGLDDVFNVELYSGKAPEQRPAPVNPMEVALQRMNNKSRFRRGQIISAAIAQADEDGLQILLPFSKKEVPLSKDELDCEEYDQAEWGKKIGDQIDLLVVDVHPPIKLSQKMIRLQKEGIIFGNATGKTNVAQGICYVLEDIKRVFPRSFVVEMRVQDSAIGMIKVSAPQYYGQSVPTNNTGRDDVYVPNVTGNKYLVKYEFADLSAVKEFLNRNVYVSLVPEPEWIKIAEPDIFNNTVGDGLYFKGKGSCELLEIFDQPNTELVKIRFANGEESSLRIIDNLILLPTFSVEESPLLKEINRAYKEQLLSPCVVSDGNTYNVYWFLIDNAAAYHVVLYKNVPRPHKQGLMRIKDYTLDRHTGYLAVPNLVGKNFVFKVYAEDREGSVLSESRGILDTGEPTEVKE